MKKVILLFGIFLSFSVVSFSQNYLTEGDNCFNAGNYSCAKEKYEKLLSIKYSQVVEIKIIRTNGCIQALSKANLFFAQKKYADAKKTFQEILDSNPNDAYAKAKIKECNDYLQPKPEPPKQTPTKTTTTLNVSTQNLSYPSSGGKQNVTITTNEISYDISLLPAWCSVTKYFTFFVVNCDSYYGGTSRKDWFQVKAGGKTIRIDVNQSGYASTSTGTNTRTNTYKSKKCFNCLKGETHPVGLSVGYVSKQIEYTFNNLDDRYEIYNFQTNLHGIQAGLRIEPLFKYGFGLNTGIFYEYYYPNTAYSDFSTNYDAEQFISIPLHLEYRFNFSEYFNVFFYGGASADINIDDIFNEDFGNKIRTNISLDTGGGIRIKHVQINAGMSWGQSNMRREYDMQGLNIKHNKNMTVSLSYMF